jgi:hypothetical protein
MAELFYPTKYKAKGPWLIDSAQLLALDDAIDQYCTKSMAAVVSTAGQDHSIVNVLSRTITFLLRHDKELQTSSFREAITNPAAANEMALGLKYEVKLRDTTAVLTLDKHKEGSSSWSSADDKIEMNIAVEPRTSPLSQELFVVMKEWAADIPRPLWLRVIIAVRWFAALVLLFWGLIFVAGLISPSPPNFKEQYKQEAGKLLQQGINASNQQKAIELLLAIQADYSPHGATSKPERSKKSIILNSTGLLWLLAIVLCPEFCLGLWKGKQRLRLLRYWLPTVFVTVPGMLFTNYIRPQLFDDLGRLLGIK